MEEKKLYLLLHVLHNNRTSKALTRNGMSFKHIAEYTNYAIENGLLRYYKGKIVITKKGAENLMTWEKEYKIQDKEQWIEKENKSKIDKIDINFIYLPKRWELDF